MFTRLAHVCIGATDLDACERFYVEQMGMEKAFDFIRAGKRIGFYVKAGETTFIEIFADAHARDSERPRIKHFCLEVADIDKTIADLTSRGLAVEPKKMGADNNWQAWLSDPSGLRIELMQYSAASTQFSGEAVILA